MWLGRVEREEKENWMELDVKYKSRECKDIIVEKYKNTGTDCPLN